MMIAAYQVPGRADSWAIFSTRLGVTSRGSFFLYFLIARDEWLFVDLLLMYEMCHYESGAFENVVQDVILSWLMFKS